MIRRRREVTVVLLRVDEGAAPAAGAAEAEPQDVARWLDQDPERARQTTLLCRRLGPPMHSHGALARCRALDGRPVAGAVAGRREDGAEEWTWWAGLGRDRVSGIASGRTEASEAILTQLLLSGWVA